MRRHPGILWIPAFVVLFLTMNRAAFQGYFQADELQNLSWTPQFPISAFLTGTLTPKFFPNNFRPVGHFYFHEAGRLFGLDFAKWVWSIDILHFLNVGMLWLLMRRLGIRQASAIAGCAFFGLHMALFDAFWKPMYVFDVLCATFCLLSLILYAHGRWILSFAAFWLAYKSKELAVMLPAVLACYELWFAKPRRWARLIPFFAASLSFGIQAMLLTPNRDSDYTFHFTAGTLAKTSAFYAGRMFLVPYVGFGVAAVFAILWARARLPRAAMFGSAMAAILFVPLLFLPARLFGAYCYVPFLGLAIALTAVPVRLLAIGLLLWTPLELRELRAQRRETLTIDSRVRTWVTTAAQFAKNAGAVDAVVYQGRIPGFAPWGMEGSLQYLFHRQTLMVRPWSDPQAPALVASGAPLLVWNPGLDTLTVQQRTANTRDLSYLEMNGTAPVWQLLEGWYDPEGWFRWTARDAAATLDRPPGARLFTIRVLAVEENTLQGRIDRDYLEPRRFAGGDWQWMTWELPPRPPGPVRVEFHWSREGDRGMPVGAFGFIAR